VQKEDGGAYLPAVFRPLDERGIRARMGTATFIMGPPGAFKTGFAMYYLLRLGLPMLYVSADAEDFETVERAAALVTGSPMSEVSKDHSKFEDALRSLSHARFCYDNSPSYKDLILEVCAFAEVEGKFPSVIAIDTLMRVTGETDDEWAAHRDTARVVDEICHKTGAAVFVLAHASDDRVDPTTPASRNKLQGRVSQLPKAIWSVALSGDELRICPVKSKWCKEDPSGQDYATLWVDPSTNRLFNSQFDMNRGVPA
jgi:KaiC/GvpD/RAD55 family RecA-like ATPase